MCAAAGLYFGVDALSSVGKDDDKTKEKVSYATIVNGVIVTVFVIALLVWLWVKLGGKNKNKREQSVKDVFGFGKRK